MTYGFISSETSENGWLTEKKKHHWAIEEDIHNGLAFQPHIFFTSSTAQGGGGSFKKRKTIGEIGCCESRMSKQKH